MPRDVEAMADVVITSMRAALAPVLERLAAAEARLGALTDVRDRLVVVETKAAMVPPAVDVAPLTQRQEALETAMTAHLKTALSLLDKDIGAVHERLALVEARAPIPGPAGPAGKDGDSGKDGRDGIALDDLSVRQLDERTLAFQARMGGQTKDLGRMTVPVEIYRGVWGGMAAYDQGDSVTWGGSEWHCNESTTAKPGEGSKAWTLKVKRGRDGKDGRDAPGASPVVKVS